MQFMSILMKRLDTQWNLIMNIMISMKAKLRKKIMIMKRARRITTMIMTTMSKDE
jgi:hypothetical protein